MRTLDYGDWDDQTQLRDPLDIASQGGFDDSFQSGQNIDLGRTSPTGRIAGVDSRRQRQGQTPSVPRGYDLRELPPNDRYAILYNRDYRRISFGSLITVDYGQLLTPDMPLGDRDDTPDFLLTGLPTTEETRINSERAGDYLCDLTFKPLPEAAKEGVDLDLIMTPREQTFCNDFLGFMAMLNHSGAEDLQLGSTFPGRTAQALGQLLRPARWTKVSWNNRACEATGEKPLSSAYCSFLGRIATDEIIADPPERMKAYPLQKLNADTWLYLCEDGKARAKVDPDVLLPPPTPGFANGPTASLSREYGEMRGLTAVQVTKELVDKTNGETKPYQTHVFPGSVLSYPPKQRLVDIAGQALTRLSARSA